MTSTNEQDLVVHLQQGSPRAFEQIFSLFHQRIYNFCHRLLPVSDDARELVQRVFIALWEQREQIDETKPIAAYLFSIARYMAYQEFRSQIYKIAALEQISNRAANYNETTKDEVLFNELTRILNDIIEKLPPRQKEIYRLSRDSGMSYKEIAGELGITENTVDTQLRRALDFIREEYRKYFR